MNAVIQEIKQSLQEQLDELDVRVQRSRDELKGLEEGRKKVGAALSALGAKVARNGQRKVACTRDYVAKVVKTVLQENDQVPRSDLMELVRGKIANEGKSLIGFGLRMKEILRSGLVNEVRPDVFKLGNLPASTKNSA